MHFFSQKDEVRNAWIIVWVFGVRGGTNASVLCGLHDCILFSPHKTPFFCVSNHFQISSSCRSNVQKAQRLEAEKIRTLPSKALVFFVEKRHVSWIRFNELPAMADYRLSYRIFSSLCPGENPCSIMPKEAQPLRHSVPANPCRCYECNAVDPYPGIRPAACCTGCAACGAGWATCQARHKSP